MSDSMMVPGFSAGSMPLGHASDARSNNGQSMPMSQPYGSRQGTSTVLWQADGTPYRTSGRFPTKGDDRTYVDIHNVNPYAQVLHTYEASHGYRDNSYLIFFPREEWYQERQKYSLRSVAAFRSVVDAMVMPVFEKEINRTTNNPLFQGFIDNADNTGTSLQDINETAQTHARMLGLTFIIMDNFDDASTAITVAQASEQRKFPYVYEKMPQDVYKWKCNSWGKLEWITFFERQEVVPDPDHEGKTIMRQYYRRWDNSGWVIYYERVNRDKYQEVTEIEDSKALHGLSYMPVYPVLDYTKINNLTNFPTPKLADLANMAFVLYNMESWIELLCVYCFPTLTLPPMDGAQIAMSVNNAIEVPNDAKFQPSFIAPPTACLEVLLKAADRLEDKIYKAANQLGVSGTKAKTSSMSSGVSKEWDFQASNSLLKKTSYAAKKLEEWCAKTFSDYTHSDASFTVDYASEFVEAYSSQRLEQAMALLKEMPPEKMKNELWKEIAKVYFDDDLKLAKIISDAIDSEYAMAIKDSAVIGGGTGEGQPVPVADNPDSGDISTETNGKSDENAFTQMMNKFLKPK